MRIIVFSPHPDDDVLGCGGILAKHVIDGDIVKNVYMTDGRYCYLHTTLLDKLISILPEHVIDGDIVKNVYMTDGRYRYLHTTLLDKLISILRRNKIPSPKELIEIRKKEAIAASRELGISKENLMFLGYEDSRLSNNLETATKRVTEILQSVSPHLIYVPHKGENHVDHIATYNILKNALDVYSSKVLIRQYQAWVPLYKPNVIFDLKDVIDIKRKAAFRHKSQLKVKVILELFKKVLNNNFEYFKSTSFLV